ncbi:hypothetical protein PV646_18180 [Streptomyces sp. ID05-26A]|nr:hypothetical protein [Streptomyces sp. ID05-26A]
MIDPIQQLTQTTGRHLQRIDDLEKELGDKTKTLGDIREQVRKLEKKVGGHSVSDVVKTIEKVDKKAGETSSRMDEASTRIDTLRHDLVTLHRKVRLSSGLPRADFDTWPEISSETIQLILAGLASEPVPEAEIERLRQNQEQAREERERWDQSLKAAITAVHVMTGLPAGAERLWRREARTWSAFRRSGNRPVDKEEHARRRHDEATFARQAAMVAADNSAAANEAVCAVIRERVVDALTRDLVPPQWFDSALGLFPPKEPGQISPWLRVATRLIRYRLLADVGDRLHPYGDRPPDSKLAAERDEVERLCKGQRW